MDFELDFAMAFAPGALRCALCEVLNYSTATALSLSKGTQYLLTP
jgi:hypothetical protein